MGKKTAVAAASAAATRSLVAGGAKYPARQSPSELDQEGRARIASSQNPKEKLVKAANSEHDKEDKEDDEDDEVGQRDGAMEDDDEEEGENEGEDGGCGAGKPQILNLRP